MSFLNAAVTQYIMQAVLHTAIIGIVVESVISIYHINKPAQQISYRFLGLLLPVIYLFFFFLLDSNRTGEQFHRQKALFDSNQWLTLRLGESFFLGYLVFGILMITAVVFLLTEGIPFIRFYFGRHPALKALQKGQFPRLEGVIKTLTVENRLPQPLVVVSAEPMPVVHTSGLKTLIVSPALVELLDDDELEAVIAHELAHFTGGVAGINLTGLALRFIMFYNPVALLLFRRLNHDLERQCDEIAVSVTGKPLALSSGLLKVFRSSHLRSPGTATSLAKPSPAGTLVGTAYRGLLKERIHRLMYPETAVNVTPDSLRITVLTGCLGALLFFVV